MGTVRVFLLDDQEVVRAGLRHLVERAEGLDLVGEAGTAAEAIARIPECRPDVVILDARLPDGSGIEVCRQVHALDPDIQSLILTSYDDDDAVLAAILAGAAGYVLKDIRNLDLVARIRSVAAGRPLLDPAIVALARARWLRGRGTRRGVALSPDERHVLGLLADGRTDHEISARLALTAADVSDLVLRVLGAVGADSGAAAGGRPAGRAG